MCDITWKPSAAINRIRLTEPEEKIINVKNVTGRSAVNTLYDVVTNGLTFTMKVAGKRRSSTARG